MIFQEDEFNKLCNTMTVSQQQLLLKLLFQLENCDSKELLHTYLNSMQELFDFSMFHANLVELNSSMNKMERVSFVQSYPDDYMSRFSQNHMYTIDPIILENYKCQGRIRRRWSDVYREYKGDIRRNPLVNHAQNWDSLKDGFSFGYLSTSHARQCLMLNFAGLLDFSEAKLERMQRIVDFLLPFICRSFEKIMQKEDESLLSMTQQRILTCIQEGKERPEIMEEMKMKTSTLRYHTEKIFEKLEVNTRASAVSKGISKGILKYI